MTVCYDIFIVVRLPYRIKQGLTELPERVVHTLVRSLPIRLERI